MLKEIILFEQIQYRILLSWSNPGFQLYFFASLLHTQGSTISIKSMYVITYVYQNFGVREVHALIPKSIYPGFPTGGEGELFKILFGA